jgi:outer membrane protein OmpA-like peptidoglycan-associated protein
MKKIMSFISAFMLSFVTLSAALPAQANGGIVITPNKLTPSHSESISVEITGLDPTKEYEFGIALIHNQTLAAGFLDGFGGPVATFTPTNAGTYSWNGLYQPNWEMDSDEQLQDGVDPGLVYMDLLFGLFPAKFYVIEKDAVVNSVDDFAALSAQLYPSSQNGIGTMDFAGNGYVDGEFISGESVTVTGSGWGDLGTVGQVGTAVVPKVFGETGSTTFWTNYFENGIFTPLFEEDQTSTDGEVEGTYTVETFPAGEFILWTYFFAFEPLEAPFSLNELRATYQLGYNVEEIAASSADAPVFTDDTLAGTANVGTEYSDSVTATGATSITYSVVEGALPTGLTLNASTGAITGTPTTSGEFDFTIKAENADGYVVAEFTIVVSESDAEPPVFTDETVALYATVGTAYSDSVTASGTGVTYSIDEGALPYGLTLNSSTGAITGTPTAAGEYTFTIKAENADGSDLAEFTMVVIDPDEEILVERVSRHQYVVLDGFPRWYSQTKDVCHVAESNKVVFTNVGRCVVSTRESGNSNSDRVFRVTGEKGESGDGRVNAFEVYFAKGSSVLDSKAIAKLSNRAAKFKNHPVVVYGYSAGKKSSDMADRLANRRAKIVAAFLEDKGVAVTMVRGVGSAFQNKKKSWKNKRALIQINRFVG